MFFRSVSQGKINKNKIKQMRPNQSYRILHNKGNYENETNQKTSQEREKLLANDVTNRA